LTTDLKPDSWDSEGNLLVPLHGIRIALGLSFLAAAAFFCFAYLSDKQWHEQNPGPGAGGFVTPLWMWTLRIALPLVPFILSALLLSTSSENSKAAGAGIAVALFSSGLLVAIAALFSFFFMQFSPVPCALQELIANLAFLACSVWILVSAFRIGKASWGIFFLTLAAPTTCLIWGNHALDAMIYKLERQQEQRKAQAAVELFNPAVQAQQCPSLAGRVPDSEPIAASSVWEFRPPDVAVLSAYHQRLDCGS
jgi:hypothetical protein